MICCFSDFSWFLIGYRHKGLVCFVTILASLSCLWGLNILYPLPIYLVGCLRMTFDEVSNLSLGSNSSVSILSFCYMKTTKRHNSCVKAEGEYGNGESTWGYENGGGSRGGSDWSWRRRCRKNVNGNLHAFEAITSTANEIVRLWFKELEHVSYSLGHVVYEIGIDASLVASLVYLEDVVTGPIESKIYQFFRYEIELASVIFKKEKMLLSTYKASRRSRSVGGWTNRRS